MQISRVKEPNKLDPQAGFTLFELMVVITIMAVLLGVSLPALNLDSGKGAFSDFERLMIGGVSEARYLSMITGKVQTLTLVNGGEISILPSGLDTTDMPDGYEITSIETLEGRKESEFRIRFYPSGLAESCAVHVTNNFEEQTFYVPPISGIEMEHGVVSLGKFQE